MGSHNQTNNSCSRSTRRPPSYTCTHSHTHYRVPPGRPFYLVGSQQKKNRFNVDRAATNVVVSQQWKKKQQQQRVTVDLARLFFFLYFHCSHRDSSLVQSLFCLSFHASLDADNSYPTKFLSPNCIYLLLLLLHLLFEVSSLRRLRVWSVIQ